jgi:hypothetical protein
MKPSPPQIFASGRGRCRAAGFTAHGKQFYIENIPGCNWTRGQSGGRRLNHQRLSDQLGLLLNC